jgi:hypothetical protein
MSSKKSSNRSRAEGQVPRFENIEALINGIGDITIGRVDAIPCAATAADEDQALAMLVRRKGESLMDLLARLDTAIGLAWEQSMFIDEIND